LRAGPFMTELSEIRKRKVLEGMKLFKGFNNKEPQFLDKVQLAVPNTLVKIGDLTGIIYLAADGHEYIHKFRRQSRGELCVTPDGRHLFIVGGKYQFTERGIVDR